MTLSVNHDSTHLPRTCPLSGTVAAWRARIHGRRGVCNPAYWSVPGQTRSPAPVSWEDAAAARRPAGIHKQGVSPLWRCLASVQPTPAGSTRNVKGARVRLAIMIPSF
jgi:hypothetical protein